jgi:hypothetical protein
MEAHESFDSSQKSVSLSAELIHLIVDNLTPNDDLDLCTLLACSLVSRVSLYSSRSILFKDICLSSQLQPFCLMKRSHPKENAFESFLSILSQSPQLAPFIKRLYIDIGYPRSNDDHIMQTALLEPLLKHMTNLGDLSIFGVQAHSVALPIMQSHQPPSLHCITISCAPLLERESRRLPLTRKCMAVLYRDDAKCIPSEELAMVGLQFPSAFLQ